jgi:hypothetical protein
MLSISSSSRRISGARAAWSGRPCHGDERRDADDPHYRDLVLLYEYFGGDTEREPPDRLAALIAPSIQELELGKPA